MLASHNNNKTKFKYFSYTIQILTSSSVPFTWLGRVVVLGAEVVGVAGMTGSTYGTVGAGVLAVVASLAEVVDTFADCVVGADAAVGAVVGAVGCNTTTYST